MATKTITFTLDPESVEEALKKVREARDDLIRIMGMLVRALTEKGVDVAKINIMAYDAFDTTLLYNSTAGIYDEASHVGIIRNDTWYAFFVEYGTGVMGEANGHPDIGGAWAPPPIQYTTTGPHGGESRVYTKYDTYEHGLAGWTYWKDGYKFTIGMPSRPFMYDTYRELEAKAKTIAAEVFGKEWR